MLVYQSWKHPYGCGITVLDEHAGNLTLSGPDITHHAFNEPGFVGRCICIWIVVIVCFAMVMLVLLDAGQIMIMVMLVVLMIVARAVFSGIAVHAPYARQVRDDESVDHVMAGR